MQSFDVTLGQAGAEASNLDDVLYGEDGQLFVCVVCLCFLLVFFFALFVVVFEWLIWFCDTDIFLPKNLIISICNPYQCVAQGVVKA